MAGSVGQESVDGISTPDDGDVLYESFSHGQLVVWKLCPNFSNDSVMGNMFDRKGQSGLRLLILVASRRTGDRKACLGFGIWLFNATPHSQIWAQPSHHFML